MCQGNPSSQGQLQTELRLNKKKTIKVKAKGKGMIKDHNNPGKRMEITISS
jgi:hypothetical protein